MTKIFGDRWTGSNITRSITRLVCLILSIVAIFVWWGKYFRLGWASSFLLQWRFDSTLQLHNKLFAFNQTIRSFSTSAVCIWAILKVVQSSSLREPAKNGLWSFKTNIQWVEPFASLWILLMNLLFQWILSVFYRFFFSWQIFSSLDINTLDTYLRKTNCCFLPLEKTQFCQVKLGAQR